MALVSEADLKKIIEEGDDKLLVERAKQVGEALKERRLSSSQIRGIFGSVRRIEMDWQAPKRNPDPERLTMAQREFSLLRPRLSYQAEKERGKGPGVIDLRDVLIPAMQMVGKEYTRFRNFVDFFEAILAYHKAAGGQ